MELEELQATWLQMSTELENQKKLTNDIIMKMTQDKYAKKFSKISMLETIGAIICFMVVLLLIINFKKLDTPFLIGCGILTLIFLIILPVVVLRLLSKIRNLDIISNTYKETLIQYTKTKNKLLFIQKANLVLSFVYFFITLPLATKIIGNKNLVLSDKGASFYILTIVVLVGLFFFARWGYRSYKKIIAGAENVIKELE